MLESINDVQIKSGNNLWPKYWRFIFASYCNTFTCLLSLDARTHGTDKSHHSHGPMKPCTGAVGTEDVAQHFGTESAKSNWMYWKRNLAVKTGGTWYSTPAVGEGKFWSVKQTIKQINKTCADDNIFGAVVKKNSECFNACAQPSNRTSTCFIGCFYNTTIGPGSDTIPFETNTLPEGDTIFTTTELAALYDSSFDVCPPV
eukprot:m.280207 g.280207  ORF g.280207 m.280207 type:complete len:201 (+) comp19821_c0_seq3:549-1151(+)